MTTITNLNVLVQHGDNVKDVQNIKNQHLDHSQLTKAEHHKKEDMQRVVVKESDDSHNVNSDAKKNAFKKKMNKMSKRKRKKHNKLKALRNPDRLTGKILDTVV